MDQRELKLLRDEPKHSQNAEMLFLRYEKAPAGMLLLRNAMFEVRKSPCGHITAQKYYLLGTKKTLRECHCSEMPLSSGCSRLDCLSPYIYIYIYIPYIYIYFPDLSATWTIHSHSVLCASLCTLSCNMSAPPPRRSSREVRSETMMQP